MVRLAAPDRCAETLAGLFLAAYCGLAAPVVGRGVATQALGARWGLLGFAALVLLGALAAACSLLFSGAPGARR